MRRVGLRKVPLCVAQPCSRTISPLLQRPHLIKSTFQDFGPFSGFAVFTGGPSHVMVKVPSIVGSWHISLMRRRLSPDEGKNTAECAIPRLQGSSVCTWSTFSPPITGPTAVGSSCAIRLRSLIWSVKAGFGVMLVRTFGSSHR